MFTKLRTTLAFAATLALTLTLLFRTANAVDSYSGSILIQSGGGGSFYLVNDGVDKILITIRNGSLDEYMAEQGITEVDITVDLIALWIDLGGGLGFYALDFIFGPSGAYFTPDKLELELRGVYFNEPTDILMYDENGEVLEWTRNGNSDKITFLIPHFSQYCYDSYCY